MYEGHSLLSNKSTLGSATPPNEFVGSCLPIAIYRWRSLDKQKKYEIKQKKN